MLIKRLSTEEYQYTSLYDFILDDKAYKLLHGLIECSNARFVKNKSFMERSFRSEIDALSIYVENSSYMKILSYEAYCLEYRKRSTLAETSRGLYPNYIVHNNIIGDVRCIPLEYKEHHGPGDDDMYTLTFKNAYLDSTDYSAELFQMSTEYNTVPLEDIREVMIRLYNLPVLPTHDLSIFGAMMNMDRLYDLEDIIEDIK